MVMGHTFNTFLHCNLEPCQTLSELSRKTYFLSVIFKKVTRTILHYSEPSQTYFKTIIFSIFQCQLWKRSVPTLLHNIDF